MMITGAQIRAGRAFAKLSANELAALAHIARTTVVRAELTDGVPPTTAANLFAIQTALERLGVTFGAGGSVSYQPRSQEG
jgi:transcriptional regulator with XRE-family HTH domain